MLRYINIIIFLILIVLVFLFVFLGKEILIFEKNEKTKISEEISDEELKERIGQMIMIGFRGTEISEDSYIVKAMRDLKIGGIVLFDFDIPSKSFPRNILNPDQTKKLISDLRSHSLIPLFLAVDAEPGEINRLKPEYGFLNIRSPKELGEIRDYDITRKEALKLSQELKDLGFNMNFAPVVDLDLNPQNPIIGALSRSFSSDPQEVVLHAQAFIEAHNQNNIISAAKHFPGHGSSKEDSHKGLVDITDTYSDKELIPYQKLIQMGMLDIIMTAHIINKKIDSEYPATLSSFFINEILRNQLGFKGVVVSDDMEMGAITKNYGFAEALIRAVNAGCDLIIISNNGEVYEEKAPYKARDIIFQAVKNKQISSQRIREASDRIYKLKNNFGIL